MQHIPRRFTLGFTTPLSRRLCVAPYRPPALSRCRPRRIPGARAGAFLSTVASLLPYSTLDFRFSAFGFASLVCCCSTRLSTFDFRLSVFGCSLFAPSAERIELDYVPDRGDPVAPPDLLPFGVGAPGIADGHLEDAGARARRA